MQYLLVIYDDEQKRAAMSADERNAIVREYFAVTDELRAAGAYVAAAPLSATATASTVRVRDRKQLVTDGPFAETKEQLGGFYLVDVESEEEAVEIARSAPASPGLAAEVRRVPEL